MSVRAVTPVRAVRKRLTLSTFVLAASLFACGDQTTTENAPTDEVVRRAVERFFSSAVDSGNVEVVSFEKLGGRQTEILGRLCYVFECELELRLMKDSAWVSKGRTWKHRWAMSHPIPRV